jgi:outer membrane murein-binding lipoprotein Lpp
MATVETLQTEVRDLRRRLELTETRVTQMEGRFEFVSGQLRDIQLYMHAKFGDVESSISELKVAQARTDSKVDALSGKVDGLNAKIDALPRVLAEMLAKR